MSRNEYSEEQKRAAVARVMRGEKALAVSRSIGMNSNSNIYNWIAKYKDTTDAAGEPIVAPTKGPKGRTVYPLALKQRAIAICKANGGNYAQAAAELNVPKSRIEKWARKGVKRGARGDHAQAPVPVPPPQQVLVAVPTRSPRSPSPFSPKDTRNYLLMMEQSTLAGIREGRIKNLRDNPELVLALNALCASAAGDD